MLRIFQYSLREKSFLYFFKFRIFFLNNSFQFIDKIELLVENHIEAFLIFVFQLHFDRVFAFINEISNNDYIDNSIVYYFI